MTAPTPDVVAQMFVLCVTYWPRFEHNDYSARAWADAFMSEGLSAADLRAALERLRTTLRHPPTVADFCDAARDVRRDRIGRATPPVADDAWTAEEQRAHASAYWRAVGDGEADPDAVALNEVGVDRTAIRQASIPPAAVAQAVRAALPAGRWKSPTERAEAERTSADEAERARQLAALASRLSERKTA